MKRFMVLSCMLISASMMNAMYQNGETECQNGEIGKKIKQEIPLIALMNFYLPGMSVKAAEQKYLAFHGRVSTNTIQNVPLSKSEHILYQNGETGKKIKQEIPLIALMDFYLPGMSVEGAEQRYLAFHGHVLTNIIHNIASPKPECTLP